MQVFDQDDNRAVGGQRRVVLVQAGQCLVLQHFRVFDLAATCGRIGAGKPQQPPDQCSRIRLIWQHGLDGGLQLALDDFGRIAVLDAKLLGKQVAQQAIGHAAQGGQTAADQQVDGHVLAAQLPFKFEHQPALA